MKTSSLLLFPVLVLAACGGVGGGHSVDVTVEGGAGKTIRLDRTVGRNVVTMDSVTLDANGKGTLSTAHLPLDFYYLNFDRSNYLILALDSTDGAQVTTNAEALGKATSVEGHKHAKALFAFLADAEVYRAQRDSVRKLVNTGSALTVVIDALFTVVFLAVMYYYSPLLTWVHQGFFAVGKGQAACGFNVV